ncbi:MAG: hypothetical protein QG652_917 [Pseudomonadota bacterium]|nr:hypothetical protein [Pseudomonadota bacterium]
MFQRMAFAFFAVFFVLLQGCVAVQSFPATARAGDTITLALGSVDGLNKSNLQISYTPQSTNIPVDLTANIRNVFKVYPDKTSRVWLDTADSANILNVFAGHGAWLNVAVLDLPATLPSGYGSFQVDFGNGVIVPNTFAVQSAETVQIISEILPAAAGTGVASSFYYYSAPGGVISGNLSKLAAIPQVVLRPQVSNSYFSLLKPSAAEYRIKLPIIGDVQALDDSSVHVIWDDKPGEFNKQIQLNWKRQGDELTVNILVPVAQAIQADLHRFSIIVLDADGINAIDPAGTPQLLSYRYFDFNGAEFAPTYTPEVVVMK